MCLTPLRQYFSYIVAVSLIVGGNRSTPRKPPTCHKWLTNFYHIMLYWVNLARVGFELKTLVHTIMTTIAWLVTCYMQSHIRCKLQCVILYTVHYYNSMQGSPHIVKTGQLDFSLSWLKGKVRENLGDFRKSIQILTFLSPLPHVPLTFTKRTCSTIILKRMQLTSLE